jgi:hypothetical protein
MQAFSVTLGGQILSDFMACLAKDVADMRRLVREERNFVFASLQRGIE